MKREFQQLLLEKGRDRMPNVLIAAAECAPISKTGGLADVVGTLPKSLAALGVDARVITPYHRVVKDKYHDKVEHMFSFSVDLGWRSQYVGIERLVVDGVTIYLVDNEYYFGDRIYSGGGPRASSTPSSPARCSTPYPTSASSPISSTATTGTRPCCPCCCAPSTATTSTAR